VDGDWVAAGGAGDWQGDGDDVWAATGLCYRYALDAITDGLWNLMRSVHEHGNEGSKTAFGSD
jgi:hypothetical protein